MLCTINVNKNWNLKKKRKFIMERDINKKK